MNRLNEENLGTAPDNPSMGDINDITASTRGKTRSDTEHFPEILRNVPQKWRTWSCTLVNSANIKYTLHTLLFAQVQIQR